MPAAVGGPHHRGHAHLTNCIHLHSHSSSTAGAGAGTGTGTGAGAGAALIRDLLALQRSRSLRDPSTSSPSFPSRRSRRQGRRPSPRVADADAAVSANSSSQNAVCGGGEKYLYHFKASKESAASDAELWRDVRNVCGIPWNWSRIHHRGKSILDAAGRSLSCGLSDPRKASSNPASAVRESNSVSLPLRASNHSVSATTSTSSESDDGVRLAHNGVGSSYSGELGIYSNKSQSSPESDLLSSGNKLRRHRSLTQKYAPRTFKDVVGQGLVVQALSNAVLRKKIGLVYVFYGPHGTGKTSCARVFAKALNCQSREHPKPCDSCSSCVSHSLGKCRDVVEIGPVGNVDAERIMDILDDVFLVPLSTQYRVFIVDDCDSLPAETWGAISKVVDRAPRHVVFILVSPNLDLPHVIVSRCQKFFFPKVKESDIVNTLQWISTSEGLDAERDALKLIASRSDGSLRDAEMTLEQLSLLGQRISLTLVQELVGLVSDEKLVDLLDLALSADTVNTVKTLREITETGVEPLALMSQLATVITDILAGTYTFTRERLRRKFFKRPTLSKEDMEKLRQALKTLSEAEKQLRASNDKITWLTAALLQLAPDKQYILPTSSDTSLNHGFLNANAYTGRDTTVDITNEQNGIHAECHSFSQEANIRNGVDCNGSMVNAFYSARRGLHTPDSHLPSTSAGKTSGTYKPAANPNMDNERIWHSVVENVQSDALRKMLGTEGRLGSLRLGIAPTVQVIFSSRVNRAKAEKFRGQILQAFECVLRSAIILEIHYESVDDLRVGRQIPLILPYESDPSRCLNKRSTYSSGGEDIARRSAKDGVDKGVCSSQVNWQQCDPHILTEGEIIEVGPSLVQWQAEPADDISGVDTRSRNVWEEDTVTSQNQASVGSYSRLSGRKVNNEQNRCQTLVRGKVTLAHVINKAEVFTQQAGWSRRKAISIAEKLEQDNLRMEPRSRSFLCWKSSHTRRRKLSGLRIRTKRAKSLSKLILCGRCISTMSPR